MDEIVFPNRVQNQLREVQKMVSDLPTLQNLADRVKKLEGELMALKARLGKHG